MQKISAGRGGTIGQVLRALFWSRRKVPGSDRLINRSAEILPEALGGVRAGLGKNSPILAAYPAHMSAPAKPVQNKMWRAVPGDLLSKAVPAASGTALVGGPASFYATRGLSDEPPTRPPAATPRKTLSVGEAAALGAGSGAIGSILYGKLAGKPDLQRDLIAAITTSLAGGALAAYADKQAMDKQALVPLIPPALTTLGSILVPAAAFVGLDYLVNASDREKQEMVERVNEARLRRMEARTSAQGQALARGTGGAALGGASGYGASLLWGKLRNNPNVARDIGMAGLGMVAGGALGASTAKDAFTKADDTFRKDYTEATE